MSIGFYTITTLKERWVDWALPRHNKCRGCGKQLGADETVGIEDIDSDYASAACLDCAVLDMQSDIEALQDAVVTIKDIQLQMGRD